MWYRPVDSWTDRVLCSACVHYCICLCLSVCKPYVWWYCTWLVYLEGLANTSSKHNVFSFHSGLHSQTQSETHTVSTHQVWNTFCVCLQASSGFFFLVFNICPFSPYCLVFRLVPRYLFYSFSFQTFYPQRQLMS